MAEQRRRGIPQGVPGRNLSAPSSRAEKLQALCGPTHDPRLAARRLLFFPAEADIL